MSLADKLAFLAALARRLSPDRPPDPVETHAAFVFLAGDRALKLKKPVRLPYLDLRSLAARERNCRAELALNRELAGDVYRGVVPMVRRPDGSLALGGPGEVVDWVVDMQRLPADRMLGHRLANGLPVSPDDIAAVGATMQHFYRNHRAQGRAPRVYLRNLLHQTAINAAHLRARRADLGGALNDTLLDDARNLVVRHSAEIAARAAAGQIVEGHGDLRPEHVCLVSPPVIFDRLEFDRDLLLVDIYDELNYLGLECARLRAAWVRAQLLDLLRDAGEPAPSAGLLTAYGVVRCLTRARLAIDHLRDRQPRTPEKWPRQARDYLGTAQDLMRAAP